jgi:hypothetical protein
MNERATASARAGYSRVLSGHGEPINRSALAATVAYLRTGKEIYAAAQGPTEYASRMKAAFPDRRHPDWIDLSASLLYGVIDAYDTEAVSGTGPPASGHLMPA